MTSKITYILAMLIFSTLGLVSSYIPLSSIGICFIRSIFGLLFFIVYKLIKREKLDLLTLKKEWKIIIPEAIVMSLSWIFLFSAFKYNVGSSTIIYYTAPIIVIIYSIIFEHEKNAIMKLSTVILTFVGLTLMIRTGGINKMSTIYSILSAICYSIFIILNKKITINSSDKNIINFIICLIVTLPFYIYNKDYKINLTLSAGIAIIILGLINTGLSYFLYFASLKNLNKDEISILSYIDPMFSFIYSMIILKEQQNIISIIGVLIIFISLVLFSFLDYHFEKKQIEDNKNQIENNKAIETLTSK